MKDDPESTHDGNTKPLPEVDQAASTEPLMADEVAGAQQTVTVQKTTRSAPLWLPWVAMVAVVAILALVALTLLPRLLTPGGVPISTPSPSLTSPPPVETPDDDGNNPPSETPEEPEEPEEPEPEPTDDPPVDPEPSPTP